MFSIEGCDIELVNKNHKPQSEFHFNLSDDSHQDVSTTHVYIISMLNELKKMTSWI